MKAICLIAVICNIVGDEQSFCLIKDQHVTNLDMFYLVFLRSGHWLIFGILG